MHPVLFEILLGLGHGPAPAAELLERLEQMEEAQGVPVATFYRQLKRGLEAGWARVKATRSPTGPGRPGQVYERTESGREAVVREARRLRRLADRALAQGEGG